MNPVYRSITDLDWMTIVLALGILILAVCKYFFKNSFFTFLILPFNNKYIGMNKKKGKLLHGFHLMMSVFQVVNMALFVLLARNLFVKERLELDPGFFGLVTAGILVFFSIKIILQIGNGYFFENYTLMTDIIFEKLSYFNYGGIIAFIGNLLLIYVLPGFEPLVYVTILSLTIINIIGVVKILRNHQKLIFASGFYFILYLCTLEIAPIAIIISYLNS